jgi:hypothetical protein
MNVSIPMPADDVLLHVIGESYNPAKVLNVIKMFAGTDDLYQATIGLRDCALATKRLMRSRQADRCAVRARIRALLTREIASTQVDKGTTYVSRFSGVTDAEHALARLPWLHDNAFSGPRSVVRNCVPGACC